MSVQGKHWNWPQMTQILSSQFKVINMLGNKLIC